MHINTSIILALLLAGALWGAHTLGQRTGDLAKTPVALEENTSLKDTILRGLYGN